MTISGYPGNSRKGVGRKRRKSVCVQSRSTNKFVFVYFNGLWLLSKARPPMIHPDIESKQTNKQVPSADNIALESSKKVTLF